MMYRIGPNEIISETALLEASENVKDAPAYFVFRYPPDGSTGFPTEVLGPYTSYGDAFRQRLPGELVAAASQEFLDAFAAAAKAQVERLGFSITDA